MATILVADDEANIRDVVQYALERDGHRVVTATNGVEAIARAAEGKVDLAVLDILMPELDGLSVCRQLRARGGLPIVFLSSRAEEVDRILGLELGGDDYVTKPFSPRELATRVKALLRRTQGTLDGSPPEQTLAHGALVMNVPRHEVRVGDDRVALTMMEFAILRALIERPGHVLSREQLMNRCYADDTHVTERTVDTHVRRLRAKLRPLGVDPIETVHGLGYRARELDR